MRGHDVACIDLRQPTRRGHRRSAPSRPVASGLGRRGVSTRKLWSALRGQTLLDLNHDGDHLGMRFVPHADHRDFIAAGRTNGSRSRRPRTVILSARPENQLAWAHRGVFRGRISHHVMFGSGPDMTDRGKPVGHCFGRLVLNVPNFLPGHRAWRGHLSVRGNRRSSASIGGSVLLVRRKEELNRR